MSKPFSYTELVARVKALLRRYYVYRGKEKVEEAERIVVKDLTIHKDAKSVYIGEKEISLTDIEYHILLLLASKRRKVSQLKISMRACGSSLIFIPVITP